MKDVFDFELFKLWRVYLSDYYLNQTINNRVSRMRVARLAFLGQISKIWPRFKLVGLKSFSWPSGLVWPNIKSVGLKKFVWPFFR